MKTNPAEFNSPIIKELLEGTCPLEEKRIVGKMRLAAKLDDARKALGWSKTDMAKKFKNRPSEITKWLSGTHNFTIDTLIEIEEVMGIKLIYMDTEIATPVKQYSAFVPGATIIAENPDVYRRMLWGSIVYFSPKSTFVQGVPFIELNKNENFRTKEAWQQRK